MSLSRQKCLAIPLHFLWTFVSSCAIIVREDHVFVLTRPTSMGQGAVAEWVAAGKFLEVIRDTRGLSPDDAAQQIGYSSKQIRRWERAEFEPPYAAMRRLLDVLRCPPEALDTILRNGKTVIDGIKAAGDFLASEQNGCLQTAQRIELLFEQLPEEEASEVIESIRRRWKKP
jgi:transcriptional regulator with XRE-family HTH domain